MKPKLRWKKNLRPSGLAGVCSGNPGHSLNMEGERYASAYEHNSLYVNKKGWWWCARGPAATLYNSCHDAPLTEAGAKSAAMDYVRKSLANAESIRAENKS